MVRGKRGMLTLVIVAVLVYVCWNPIKGLLNQLRAKVAGATGAATATNTTQTGTGGSL